MPRSGRRVFETEDLRVLPELLAMGPVISLDIGLRLLVWVDDEDEDEAQVIVEIDSDPRTKWGALGRLSEEEVDAWAVQLVQHLNRVLAEQLDEVHLRLPRPSGA